MRLLTLLDTVGPSLVDAAVRGALVLFAAHAVTSLMHRRSASARHAVWAGAIVIQLVLPLLTAFGPRWSVAAPRVIDAWLPAPPSAPLTTSTTATADRRPALRPDLPADAPLATTTTATATATTATSANATRDAATPATAVRTSAAFPSGRTVLLALWALGALLVLARLAVGTAIVAAIARRGARIDDGGWLSMTQRLASTLQIDRPLTLLRGDRLGVPVTWGIVYPVVLLPEDADAWPEERRRYVLVHEMAHIKRLDALTQLAGQLALALFWFDPLVWIANRRMQLEREHACDDYVLRHGTPASHYAEELLAMVRAIGTPQHEGARPAFAALAMARRSEFEGRMLSILDPVQDRHPLTRGRTLMGALATLLVVVPLAALRPYPAPAQRGTPPDTGTAAATTVTPAAHADTSLPASIARVDSLAPTPPVATSPARQATAASVVTPSSVSPMWPASPMTPTSPTSPTSPMSPTSSANTVSSGATQSASCNSFAANTTGASSHVHVSDDGDGGGIFNYVGVSDDRCRQASIVGRVTYTANEDDIAAMEPGAYATFRERTSADDRELVIRRASDGTVVHELRRNGASAAYDEPARRWFAGFLPVFLREVGLNVGPRVARLRAEGGVERVLSVIGSMRSTGARRAHYIALLDGGRLMNDEMDRVIRQAGRDLRGASGDLRAVLARAARDGGTTSRSVGALEEAIGSIPSSGDRANVIRAFGETSSREVLLALMRLIEGVPSSGDRASLLRTFAPRYLAGNDEGLRTAYFHAVATLPSSGDARSVLGGSMMGYAAASETVAHEVIRAVLGISASGDRADVLVRLANVGALRTTALRGEHLRAAKTLSSGDAVRVLEAAARH